MTIDRLPFYGPVHSRRSGKSLGVCLGGDLKACNWNCSYCQCGSLDFKRESLSYHWDFDFLFEKSKEYLFRLSNLDSITIAGQIEPTLHPQFSEAVEWLLSLRAAVDKKFKIEVYTNGSGLLLSGVLEACHKLNETWIKLDAGDSETMMAVNGTHGSKCFDLQMKRIRLFDEPLIQTMLIGGEGRINTDGVSLENLRHALISVHPRKINLVTVEREPADKNLKPYSTELMNCFAASLREEGLDVSVFPSRHEEVKSFSIEHSVV